MFLTTKQARFSHPPVLEQFGIILKMCIQSTYLTPSILKNVRQNILASSQADQWQI